MDQSLKHKTWYCKDPRRKHREVPWYRSWKWFVCIWYQKHKQQKQKSTNWEYIKRKSFWASLVAQWLRICLPRQGTQVRALVWEDPTCRGATKPVRHNYWACVPRERTPQEKALQSEACAPQRKSSPHSPQLEKAHAQQRRPNAAINK